MRKLISNHQLMRCVGGGDCDVDAASHESVGVMATFVTSVAAMFDAAIHVSMDGLPWWMPL